MNNLNPRLPRQSGTQQEEDSFHYTWSVAVYGTEELDTTENTELFMSPSGISELDCATIKTVTAERSISIGRESLQVFFVLRALAYFQVPPLEGSRDKKWRSQ